MTIAYAFVSMIVALAAALLALVEFGWIAAILTYAGVGGLVVLGMGFLISTKLPDRRTNFRSRVPKTATKSAVH